MQFILGLFILMHSFVFAGHIHVYAVLIPSQ